MTLANLYAVTCVTSQNEHMFAFRKKIGKRLDKKIKKISKKVDKQVALCEDPQIVPNLTGLAETSN